jgi:hypothetical protein
MRKKLFFGTVLTAIVLTVAACQPAKSAEHGDRHGGPGIGAGVHVGPGGAGVHVGPLHGGVGVAPEHREFHRGFRVFAQPRGWYVGDPCWEVVRGFDGRRYWEYICD